MKIGPFDVPGYHVGDCRDLLRQLPDESINCVVTSPPYWGLRDYGRSGQLGLETTPEAYVASMVEVFSDVRRVLRSDGTLWLNLGDSYASGEVGRKDGGGAGRHIGLVQSPRSERRVRLVTGLPKKNLIGIPWRVAFALQADGWVLRSEIIWAKPGGMPENADRPSRRHEHLFMLSRSSSYSYDKSTDKGTVWPITPEPTPDAHFATFPTKLVEPCILAGCPMGGVVLDPFGGSGTTGRVAEDLGRNWLLFDLSSDYAAIAKRKTAQTGIMWGAK